MAMAAAAAAAAAQMLFPQPCSWRRRGKKPKKPFHMSKTKSSRRFRTIFVSVHVNMNKKQPNEACMGGS